MGAWAGPGLQAWGSQDLPLPFPVPPSPWTASSLHTPFPGLPPPPYLNPAVFGVFRLSPPLLQPLLLSVPYPPPHSKAIRPCWPQSLCPSAQAPTPAPRLPPHFSLPVLMSRIHLPLSKLHPLLLSLSHLETKAHRPRNRLTRSWKTRTHTRAPEAPVEGGTQRRRLSVHARKHPHPQPPPCPHKGADTLGGRHKGAHICGRRGTPPPWHTPRRRRRAGGRPRPRSLGLPPVLPANVSLLGLPGLWGKGLRNAAGATWGKVGTDCSRPGPAGGFPNRETMCGESRVAGEPPPPPSRPLPAPPPAALGPPRPLPAARRAGACWPACLAAYRRCLDSEGGRGRLFCPRRVNRQTPGRRTISVLSVQECGSGGGVGRGPSGQP